MVGRCCHAPTCSLTVPPDPSAPPKRALDSPLDSPLPDIHDVGSQQKSRKELHAGGLRHPGAQPWPLPVGAVEIPFPL